MQGNQCQTPAHTLSCAGANRLPIISTQRRAGEVVGMGFQLSVDLDHCADHRVNGGHRKAAAGFQYRAEIDCRQWPKSKRFERASAARQLLALGLELLDQG